MKKVVILGLKRKSDGELFVYDVRNNQGRKSDHIHVKLNQEYILPVVSVYPFDTFSTLDVHASYWNEFDKCYLEVDTDISDNEYQNMKSSGIMYFQFNNRKTVILREYVEPLAYFEKMYREFGNNLGFFNFRAFVLEEKIYSKQELETGKRLIKKMLKNHSKKEYGTIDMYITKYNLPLINYMLDIEHKYHVTIHFHITRDGKKPTLKDINTQDFSVDELIRLTKDTNDNKFLEHNNFKKYIEIKENLDTFLQTEFIDKPSDFHNTELPKLLEQYGVNCHVLAFNILTKKLSQSLDSHLDYEEIENYYHDFWEFINDNTIEDDIEYAYEYEWDYNFDFDYDYDDFEPTPIEVTYVSNPRARFVYNEIEYLGIFDEYVDTDWFFTTLFDKIESEHIQKLILEKYHR